MQRYPVERITPPANWKPGSETRPAGAGNRAAAPFNRNVPPGGLEEIAAYYAAITALDDQVGRLMKTLEATGQADNTIVLFTSDHGDMLGSHGMRRKRKPHDESARVPGILSWPARIPKGRVVDTLFSHIDMPPTLLALTGLGIPDSMQGSDLSRVALGQTTDGPDAVLLQIFVPYHPDGITRPWRGIVTADHTYARFEDEPWVLFNQAIDPSQLQNLVGRPEHESLQKSLDRKLAELMKSKGDAWSFNSMDLVEEGGRLYRHGTFYTLDEYRAWAKDHPDLAK
jgi:arylsulfatase A-like enzyme